MGDEHADESHHFLHGAVRVIEKSSVLMNSELVNVCSSGRHRLLADPGHAVLLDGKFQAVPVHRSAFRKRVFKHDANAIAARDLNGRAGA